MSTRRSFLKTATAAGLAPLLTSLWPQSARAEGRTALPKRLVVFFTPNGTNPETWFPIGGPGGETDFELRPLHESLESWKQRLIFTRGIDMKSLELGPGEPHQRGMGALLTGSHLQEGTFVGGDGTLAGWANGISVDQVVAEAIGGATAKKSVELGVRVLGSDVRHRLSYLGPAQPLPPQTNPHLAFESLFGELGNDPLLKKKNRDRRKSVLDAAQAQMALLRKRVSTADRLKLDEHHAMLRDMEKQLWAEVEIGGACALPKAPLPLEQPEAEEHMQEVALQQIDLLSMVLACDISRVVTLQFSAGTNNIRFPFLGSYADDHILSHSGPNDSTSIAEWAYRQSWYAQQFAYLLARLDAIPEKEGTLLDNTLVLWCSELAQGNTHSHKDMPFILAGGAGGQLKTGRYLQYESKPHNDLLIAILNLMGVPADTFGDPDYVTGILPGLV